jgi:hypothetical protein
VQSAVDRQKPPSGFSKHNPPVHLFDRHWLLAVHVVPGHEATQTPPRQFPLWHWADVEQGVVLPYGILQVPPRQTSPVAQLTPGPQTVPGGHATVQGGGGLAAAAGASADCSSGVVHTAAPTTAPRRSRARREIPCALGAGVIASGRPDSGADSIPETAVR